MSKARRHRSPAADPEKTNTAQFRRERDEARTQQAVTAEILQVISNSRTNIQPVFDAIVHAGTRLFPEAGVAIAVRDGDVVKAISIADSNPVRADAWRCKFPIPLTREYTNGVAILDCRIVDIPDVNKAQGGQAAGRRNYLDVGYRGVTIVPLMRGDVAIGALSVVRVAPGKLAQTQISLLKTFADQALIAIENTRLLNELRESLQQQTATSEVLGVISSSPTDVHPVFETIANNSVNLCGATYCIVYNFDGEMISVVAHHNLDRAALDALNEIWPMRPDPRSIVGRTILERDVLHIEDVAAESNYSFANARRTALGIRTYLGVPMMREGQPIGAIALYRRDVKPFSDRQIELVKAFADQAVIAIENVRLFERVEARTHELAKSLDELRTTQDRLVQTQKLASLGQLTAGIAHEIKNPLNFVNNFSGVSAELVDELQEALKESSLNQKKRDDIAELMNTLRGNLDKVVQHGKRADAIVKNMLLHSHQGSSEHRPVAINALVEESLKLAYHGARAEKQNFNIMVEQAFDPGAGEADIFPQEITRVLLNLISNGVYATRNKGLLGGEIYKPTLTASTKDLGDRVEIRIRDNGTGIQSDVKEKMFNPFFTTKPAGEGTGLGLSISHDIIVKQHGGAIEIDTEPGEFTEIRIILPRTAVLISK